MKIRKLSLFFCSILIIACSKKSSDSQSPVATDIQTNSDGDEICNPQATVQATKTKIAWKAWAYYSGRIDHEIYAKAQCDELEQYRKFSTKEECVMDCSLSYGVLHNAFCPDSDGKKTDVIKSAFSICDYR